MLFFIRVSQTRFSPSLSTQGRHHRPPPDRFTPLTERPALPSPSALSMADARSPRYGRARSVHPPGWLVSLRRPSFLCKANNVPRVHLPHPFLCGCIQGGLRPHWWDRALCVMLASQALAHSGAPAQRGPWCQTLTGCVTISPFRRQPLDGAGLRVP